jgi:hypothetical protein
VARGEVAGRPPAPGLPPEDSPADVEQGLPLAQSRE